VLRALPQILVEQAVELLGPFVMNGSLKLPLLTTGQISMILSSDHILKTCMILNRKQVIRKLSANQ